MATRPPGWALFLLALLAALAPRGVAAAPPPPAPAIAGSYLLAGGHVAWLFEPGRGARGFTAEALFHPDAVGQFSARLARHRLGFSLRFNRSVVVDRLRNKGVEIGVRRWLGQAERPLLPFVELGLGQCQVDDRRAVGEASTWTALLGAGAERALGDRWILQGMLHLRSLEFAAESLTHAGFTLTLGGRIDS